MTTPKVDFRQLIRDGKITDDRAGQLIALDNYEGDILTDSEESTLRRGAKNPSILGDYIRGSNRLLRVEPNYLAAVTEIDRDINYIMWALSAIKHTAVVAYKEPEVKIVTEEKYKQLPEEKHQQRKQRTYRLITLYQAIVEDIVYNRKDQHKALLDKIEAEADRAAEKAKGTEREGYIFGLRLIEDGWEIYDGWGGSDEGDFTLADFADDLPELHALVMDEMRQLYKGGKLSIDPDSVKLEGYKDTKLPGEELDGIGIKRLQEWFTAIEGRDSVLDDYWQDQFIPKHQQESAIIATKYQKYAILQNPRERDVEDGYFKRDLLWKMEDGPLFGYTREGDKAIDHATGYDELLIHRLTRCRNSIILNAKLITMFVEFRLKAGQLLHIDKSDSFVARSEDTFNLENRYQQYQAWTSIYQLDDIQAQISDNKALDYLKRVQKTVAPLNDPIPMSKIRKGMTQEERSKIIQSHYPSPKDTDEWIKQDPYVQRGMVMVEEMTLSNIERTSDRMLDVLREMLKEVETPSEPIPEQG